MPLTGKPSGASFGSSSGAWLPSPYGASSVEVLSSTASVDSAAGAASSAGAGAAAFCCCYAATRRARSASSVTVRCATSSITAMGALSPLRGSVLVIRV